jgi:hypothetical protein
MNGLLLIAILIFIFRNSRSASTTTGVGGNTCANPYKYGHALGLWLFILTAYGYLSENAVAAKFIFYAICAVLVFPSFFSYLTSLLGAYKISYFLGRISFLYFGRSAYAGALYRGLQAVDRLKDQSVKTAALYWLKSRYVKRHRAIYSGEMALIVIIEAKLKRPGDPRYLAGQLDLLDGIGKASIPGPVSRYASKIALAPALSDGNWEDIVRKAKQWDTADSNPISQYLLFYFQRHIEKSKAPLFPALLTDQLVLSGYKPIYRLPEYLRDPTPLNIDMQKMDVLPALWLMRPHQRRSKDKHWYLEQFSKKLSDESRIYWLRRSRELDVWNPEQSWKNIVASVHRYATLSASGMEGNNTDPNDAKEQRFKHLKYIGDSIERRLEKHKTTYGIGDFLDWMNIWQNLSALKPNEQDLNTAFTAIHDTLWSWIVLMWNKKTNRCLAHHMATVCAPIADACGLEDFHDTLRGIEMGFYR